MAAGADVVGDFSTMQAELCGMGAVDVDVAVRNGLDNDCLDLLDDLSFEF